MGGGGGGGGGGILTKFTILYNDTTHSTKMNQNEIKVK